MDPCMILGTAGAIANVIDVLAKTLRGINDLRCQWRDADLSVLTLETQLAALGAALGRIKQWTETSDGEIHHQLVMDLDRSVACCRVLVDKIDAEVSQFRFTNNSLQASSRFRLLLKTSDFEKVQVMIERQTAALGLLLTACNTTALAEQKALLEQRPVRKALRKVQSDSASLIVHRDGDSMGTSRTMASMVSQLSALFDFDTELFSTAIYRTWMKGVVKQRHGQARSPSHPGQRPDYKSPVRPGALILAYGLDGQEDFIQRLNLDFVCGASPDELPFHAPAIRECAVKSVSSFLVAAEGLKTDATSEWVRRAVEQVEQHLSRATDAGSSHERSATPDLTHESLSTLVRQFSLLKDRIGPVYHDLLSGLRPSEAYFLTHLSRITSSPYTPTHLDVAHSLTHKTALSESRFDRRSSRRHYQATGHSTTTFRLINMDTSPAPLLPHEPHLRPFTYSLFVVDLSRYDDPSNPILRTLARLKAHVAAPKPRPRTLSVVVVILYNVDLFLAKLKRGVPLGRNFPAYHDGWWRADDVSAVIYFEGMFRQAAKGEGGSGSGGWLVDVLRVRSGEEGVLGRVTDARRWDGVEVRAREVVFGLRSEGVL